MLKNTPIPYMSPPVQSAVTTNVYAEPWPSARADDEREGWHQAIELQLLEWGLHPEELEEEGTEAPSRATIVRVIQVAQTMGQAAVPGPDRVVPAVHAGIVFERQDSNRFETIRICGDGSIEHCLFEDCRLVLRESLPRALFATA